MKRPRNVTDASRMFALQFTPIQLMNVTQKCRYGQMPLDCNIGKRGISLVMSARKSSFTIVQYSPFQFNDSASPTAETHRSARHYVAVVLSESPKSIQRRWSPNYKAHNTKRVICVICSAGYI